MSNERNEDAESPRWGWCNPGQHRTGEFRPYAWVEQGSGAGAILGACPEHMEEHGLTPLTS